MHAKGAPMADIIAIDNKRKIKDKERSDLIRMHKIMAVRKVFHCTHCASKCEKCGSQLGLDPIDGQTTKKNPQVPYNFCESCSEEYKDYIARLQGKGNPAYYWHNDAWLDIWQKWIHYQHTIDTFLKSKEFTRLLQELKQGGSI
jgi:hypothetical protein